MPPSQPSPDDGDSDHNDSGSRTGTGSGDGSGSGSGSGSGAGNENQNESENEHGDEHENDENTPDQPTTPATTPRRASNAKRKGANNGPTTPTNRRASTGQAPKSAPAASGAGGSGGASGVRKRSGPQKVVQPTLLGDFLLGRPSPARVAATKQAMRRKSTDAAAVKAELRQQMRQSSVQRLQRPGGVQDRVKAWQKANAAAMVKGNPEAAPSEPTEFAEQVDAESVTEEDRVRIKKGRKPKPRKPSSTPRSTGNNTQEGENGSGHTETEEKHEDGAKEDNTEEKEVPKKPRPKSPPKSPPKKRIVSDEHWMKGRRRSPPRPTATPKIKPETTSSPAPIPKDFLQRTAQNPSVQSKIKDWAMRVEVPPETPAPRVKKYTTKSGDTVTVEEDQGSGRQSAPENSSRPRPERRTRSPKPVKPPNSPDGAMRARPSRTKNTAESGARRATEAKSLPDEDTKTRPTPTRKVSMDEITVRPSSRTSSADRSTRITQVRSEPSQSGRIEVIEEPEPVVDTPTRIPKHKKRARPDKGKRAASPAETRVSEEATETRSPHDDFSSSSSGSLSREGSHGPSTAPGKSLAEIPFGFSAFSELDLPTGAYTTTPRKPKAHRNPSLKAVPQVFKKVVSEGKKIIQEKVDPPKPVVNQPPSIESWLNNTVDPFVEPSATQKSKPAEEEWKHETRRESRRESRQEFRHEPKQESRHEPRQELRQESKQESRQESRQDSRRESRHESRQEPRRRSASEMREKDSPSPALRPAANDHENQENADPKVSKEVTDETPKKESDTASSSKSSGLKRSRATRSTSSPLKPGAKKPFRDVLREAFRGESGGHKLSPTAYMSYEDEREYEDDFSEVYDELPQRHSGNSPRRSPSPEPSLSVESSLKSSSLNSSAVDSTLSEEDFPRRRAPPPTNGLHELSTIVSMESFSTHPSDTLSTISESTVTQATALTKSTKSTDLSRQRSRKSSSSGLKRRLTKHSDLVSVLSLPENAERPARAKSIRVARSLHRKTSKLDHASLDDLLREFAEDENIYQRELKTLVDGVIPVLLRQFVNRDPRAVGDLFGPDASSRRADAMAKSVVDMGVVLEKIRNFHRRVPLHDAPRLLTWLESVCPVYNKYLDVWRLGFQDIIVNLAPASGRPDDEDSLINAMDRNEDGDVLDENGERVDVAHLLKRPLVRIRWMLKFAKGAHVVVGGPIGKEIVDSFEALQLKARRRHKEETARKADEDANSTDTTRARNLKDLAPIDDVVVDQTRQVNAKDWFSLDLSHSNGQRLECQVELIYRDKPGDPTDKGDVLIRETGSGRRSWLLFPPVLCSEISARKGDSSLSLVAMIRGEDHEGYAWYELITLTTDYEDSITDWLEILGSTPIPPSANATAITVSRYTSPFSPTRAPEADVPVGEPKFQVPSSPRPESRSSFSHSPSPTPTPPESSRTPTPTRYHKRSDSGGPLSPTTPTSPLAGRSSSPSSQSPTHSPQRHSLPQVPPPPSTHPLREEMRPDPTKLKATTPNSTPFREDGAPPPPIHRTLKAPASLNPPVELAPASRVKRRTSSPLKHEYHPSDSSSSEDDSVSQSSESESESSSDELDEDDLPDDTLPGISIKKPEMPAGSAESVVSESSLTPSNSASQAGLARTGPTSDYSLRFVATISYWSNKRGIWKDLGDQACAIVITPGLIEAHPLNSAQPVYGAHQLSSAGSSSDIGNSGHMDNGSARPLIALDLTPLVMIRQSTVIDLEIRSPVRSYCKYNRIDGNIFRFRAPAPAELSSLYAAVHRSRMNNAKFKALEEEARFRSFGQPQESAEGGGGGGDDSSSHRRRSWFGRRNSYRASTRAPSQSQGSSSSISASSFLRKLTGGINPSFNIDRSSVDKQSRAGSGSGSGSGSGGTSLYGSGSSSFTDTGYAGTLPRSPSVSLAESSNRGVQALGSSNLKIRCHLQVSASKWEDHGNCLLTIARPPPGVRQELNIYHGREKRVLVTSIPKKEGERPLVVLDVVVGSACFKRLAARGIVLNVWEDVRDENNVVGSAPRAGAVGGKVKKWCFQCSSAAVAGWIFGLVASEVDIA